MALNKTVLKKLLNVNPQDMKIEGISLETSVSHDTVLIIKAGLTQQSACKCPICREQVPCYDRSSNTRLWRTLDFHNLYTYIEGPAYRVECPEHGVITVAVPWAAPNSRFTHAFDMEVAWLARENTRSMVSEYFSIDWESVGGCISRTMSIIEPDPSCRYENLRYIGIDETSRKKGHKYITVVVNHEKNEVVWVGEGKGDDVLSGFFELLSQEQREAIRVVTADGAGWITDCVSRYCPNATRCMDAFHTVEWINNAIDDLRRENWNQACQDLKKLKGEASAEAKRQALDRIRLEFDEEISNLQAVIHSNRSQEKLIAAQIADLKVRKKTIRAEIAVLKDQAIQTLCEARSLFLKALKLSGKSFTELAFPALGLLYEYYETKQRIEKAHSLISSMTEQLTSLKPKIPELTGERRLLSDKLKKLKAKKKSTLSAAKKKSYAINGIKTDDLTEGINQAEQKAKLLKGSKYAFLMNPENLYDNQQAKLELIENSYPELYRAYQLKESIRIILRGKDPDFAEAELENWLAEARASGISRLHDLADKIERHKTHIINTIRVGMSNARIEATNTKIKLIIRKAYGFRNIENLKAMVKLVCSDLDIPRCHRPTTGRRKAKKRRTVSRKAA